MRILVILFSLLSYSCVAQLSYDRPFRIHIYGLFSNPTGNFSSKSNNLFLVGQSKSGWGAGLRLTTPVAGQFHVGIGYNGMDYKPDIAKIEQQAYVMYDDADNYTAVKSNLDIFTVHRLFGEFSKVFLLEHLEFEPYIQLAYVLAEFGSSTGVKIHRKRQGSNYSEDILILSNNKGSPSSFGGAVGIRTNKRIATVLNVFVAARYDFTGNVKFRYRTQQKDYTGYSYPDNSILLKNNITAFTIEAGLQFRMWRAEKQPTQ